MDFLIDILMPVYNHQPYLEDALNGIISQKTDFKFRLLVGEDCSKDHSREIILKYQQKHPAIIFPYYRKVNVGAHENSKLLFKEVKSKYIAICEGDDYWLDTLKLQKQIGFLEANREYAISFHNVFEETNGKKILSNANLLKETTFTIKELAKGNFIHTPSVVYRTGLIEQLPNWYSDAPAADYVMHMLNARKGLIKYFPEPMAVYRIHAQGIWNSEKYEYRLLNTIKTIDLMINEFDGNVKEILIKQNAGYYNSLAKIAYSERDVEKAKRYLENAFFLDDSLKEEWLINYYPTLISRLFNSRRYKAAERFFNFINRVLFIGQRKKKQ